MPPAPETTPGAGRPDVLWEIDLPLPDRIAGKVRRSWALANDRRLFVTTDRLSAFDRVLAAVPGKGQVLNQLAAWWFAETADVIANHVIAVPDPNVLVAVATRPLPVEVIVRAHITGVTSTSLWTRYADGARLIDGHHLPDGLHQHDELPEPLITPTTKPSDGSHDEPISEAEVVSRGLVDAATWDQVREAALAVFARGRAVAAAAGLILADTKYEFGRAPDGTVMLIDEMHTPDSSRYWDGATYEARRAAGLDPESFDKEPVRRAFAALGYRGDGVPPVVDDAVWSDTADRYRAAYERLTGLRFVPGSIPVAERVTRAVAELLS